MLTITVMFDKYSINTEFNPVYCGDVTARWVYSVSSNHAKARTI